MIAFKDKFKQVVSMAETTTKEKFAKALDLIAKNNLYEGEELCRSILKEDPKHFGALLQMTSIASDAKQYDDELIYANEALKAKPGNPAVIKVMGIIFLHKEDYYKAEIKCISSSRDYI